MPARIQAVGFAQAGASLDGAKKAEEVLAESNNKKGDPARRWQARRVFIDRQNLGRLQAVHLAVLSIVMEYARKHQVSEEQIAIDACSCPRTPGEILAAPLCAVELDTGERDSPIFVSIPMQLDCPMARRFSYGEFCLDQKRISLYRKYGI